MRKRIRKGGIDSINILSQETILSSGRNLELTDSGELVE